jgi:virulence factor Mce-like protein
MKRIAIGTAFVVLIGTFVVFATGASNGSGSAAGTYKIELDNAFGLVNGEDFKVAGVVAGSIKSIDLDPKNLHAVVTVKLNEGGFGQFRSDTFCESRPQSLIGEYFINCDPGTSSKVLRPGSTIPVDQTESTIPADLLQDVMRMPYRQRLTLLINELGAGVAGNSQNLQAALDRAVPALSETDNLLHLLANDSHILQDLTKNSNTVITALANNRAQVQRFIVEANDAATDTATQQANLRSTFADLPGFLEQLKPALAKLSDATTANEPVLANLNAAAGQIDRLFKDIPPFAHSAKPAIKSLGQASVTGKSAVNAAGPTIADLNKFSKHTPELAQNLAIVLHDLDDRSRAVERDPRSPGGKGFTGLEALLGYVFNQTLAINTYDQFGHQLTVDAFVSAMCTPYATPSTIATNLKQFGASYRSCYSWLGPNQPGVNEKDPSAPSAAVPDPGGAPPGLSGPKTSARKLLASDPFKTATRAKRHPSNKRRNGRKAHHGAAPGHSTTGTGSTSTGGSTGSEGSGSTPKPSAPAINLGKTVGAILGLFGAGGSSTSSQPTPASGSGTQGGGNQTQQLLNYLLSP